MAKNNYREIYRGYRDEKDSPFKVRKEEREREMRKEAISRHRNKRNGPLILLRRSQKNYRP